MAGCYEGCFARFHIAYRCSEVGGRTVRRLEERVQLIIPGDQVRLSAPAMPVTREHIERWPEQYAAFRARQTFGIRFSLRMAKLIGAASQLRNRWHHWKNPGLDAPQNVLYQKSIAAVLADRSKMAAASTRDLRKDLETVINKED